MPPLLLKRRPQTLRSHFLWGKFLFTPGTVPCPAFSFSIIRPDYKHMKSQILILRSAVSTAMLLLFVAGCGQSEPAKTDATTNAATTGSSPLTAPADYLGAIQKGKTSAEKTVDTASINKAIQLFSVENGRNPKDLNELVQEKFLPKLPDAPYGMQFNYDAANGKVSVVPKTQ
jgi:hypothetical protein